jgi:uncharacterized damage-inducible protein DinB
LTDHPKGGYEKRRKYAAHVNPDHVCSIRVGLGAWPKFAVIGQSMSQVPSWFERKFEFSFPVELLPNLRARLRGTPPRLEETLRGRPHEILIKKAQEKWSAQEHAGHLLDLEPLWLARVDDYVTASDRLTAADLRNRKTDEAKHNARPLEQLLTEFRAARERLLKGVDELESSLFARAILHPRLQTPMRLADHLYFVAEHDDHHLAQIWELVKAVG